MTIADKSDLVKRLRTRADDKFIRDALIMREAADEIERLRAKILRAGIKRHTISGSDAAEDDDL